MMKQVLQDLKSGATEIVDVPTPQLMKGHLLIKSSASVVSVGTEKMLVDFGKAGYLEKARQQPDKVKQVIDKIRTDGLVPTIQAVRTKLDQPLPLGYSNAGVVIGVGEGVEGYSIGDRVVSNGQHADYVSVPKNLCAKIPDNVDDESAAFTVIGAIGLQGLRLAQPTLGEYFVVTGLGLIGLITVQLLIAQGCRVLGIDMNPARIKLARQFGAEVVDLSQGEDPLAAAVQFAKGRGVDGVIITASTKSSEPVHQAALMCRKRGRIVLVGVTGLELSRADFYEKELTFQVSCSYGPGRYDTAYEQKGQDYPIGFVRWTEQRNFEAILEMISAGKLDMKALISHTYTIEQGEEAYRTLSENRSSLGIVLSYPNSDRETDPARTVVLPRTTVQADANKAASAVAIGMIGAGNFTNQVLLPAISKAKPKLVSIASSGGVHGVHVGKKFGFEKATTSSEEVIADPEVNTVFVTTRHDTHARFTLDALKAGKHVFVEKPLCLKESELEQIEAQPMRSGQILMVGFNRRFAPHIVKMKQLLDRSPKPKTFIMTVNAGTIPSSHWTQDPEVGGGRIVGEACHFVDLLRFLTGHRIIGIQAAKIGAFPGYEIREDKMSVTLSFEDGSIGTIHYFANGHKSYPKEKLDVFCGEKILSLNNFKTLMGYGWSDFKKLKLWNQDKGHSNGVRAFLDAVRTGAPSPIPIEEIFEVTRATFQILKAAK